MSTVTGFGIRQEIWNWTLEHSLLKLLQLYDSQYPEIILNLILHIIWLRYRTRWAIPPPCNKSALQAIYLPCNKPALQALHLPCNKPALPAIYYKVVEIEFFVVSLFLILTINENGFSIGLLHHPLFCILLDLLESLWMYTNFYNLFPMWHCDSFLPLNARWVRLENEVWSQ